MVMPWRMDLRQYQGQVRPYNERKTSSYEGHSLKNVVMPVYMMKELGVKTLIVTNAAGAINKSYSAGDMMIITDHINFTGHNPLTGENDDRLGTRFPGYEPGI